MLYRQTMLDRAMLAGDDGLTEMILREIPRSMFLPNCVGNNMIAGLCPILSPLSKESSLNRLCPRLVLASEKWRRAHGGVNPPSLDALVPDYLADVPRDPWTLPSAAESCEVPLASPGKPCWSQPSQTRLHHQSLVTPQPSTPSWWPHWAPAFGPLGQDGGVWAGSWVGGASSTHTRFLCTSST